MYQIDHILKHLPHRYPFLFVDRVIAVEEGVSIHAQKSVTIGEDFFNGHFPDKPVMPGVIIIEALAQASGILGFMTMNKTPCLLYTSPSPRDVEESRMPSSA